MKLLKYKGILFDEWTEDEYGIYSEMCEFCKEKYKDRIDFEFDEGCGCGACSVLGCSNVGLDVDLDMDYIDFDIKGIEFVEKNICTSCGKECYVPDIVFKNDKTTICEECSIDYEEIDGEIVLRKEF